MAPWRIVQRISAFGLDVLAERTCADCGQELRSPGAFCPRCEERVGPSLRTLLGDGTPVHAAGAYQGPLKGAIAALKYAGRADLGIPLGRWAARRLDVPSRAAARIVPVALHPSRVVERGFNQTVLIARGLTAPLGLGLAPDLISRERRTAAQARLKGSARRANVQDAFRIRGRVHGAIWVLDDVVTTGSTAAACVATLRAGGANVQGVLCLALARGSTTSGAPLR